MYFNKWYTNIGGIFLFCWILQNIFVWLKIMHRQIYRLNMFYPNGLYNAFLWQPKVVRIPTMTSSNWNISAFLALCAGNSPVTSEFPSQMPVTRSLMFFICTSACGWVNSRDAGDLRRHRAHYDVTLVVTTGGTTGRRYNDLPCDQWRQSLHHDNSRSSVVHAPSHQSGTDFVCALLNDSFRYLNCFILCRFLRVVNTSGVPCIDTDSL